MSRRCEGQSFYAIMLDNFNPDNNSESNTQSQWFLSRCGQLNYLRSQSTEPASAPVRQPVTLYKRMYIEDKSLDDNNGNPQPGAIYQLTRN